MSGPTGRRATLSWVLAALVLLAVGWSLAPHGAPPVYDGLGFPDEPYRFVAHVAGSTATKHPTTASTTVPVSDGLAGAVSMNSAEMAPQVSVLIPVGRLAAPGGTKDIALSARPQAPSAAPDGKYFWSNAYVLSASTPGVTLVDKRPPATITLRAGDAQRPYPTIARRTADGWTPVETIPVGRDIYQATLPALGTYAVLGTAPLELAANGGGARGDHTSVTGVLVAVVAGLVVVGLVVVAVVRRRRSVP